MRIPSVLLCVCLLSAGCGAEQAPAAAPATSHGPTVEEITGRAYDACLEAIRGQLKSPATAQFSERSAATEARDGGDFYFSGSVDSENGFGALLRSEFGCQIRHTPPDTFDPVIAEVGE